MRAVSHRPYRAVLLSGLAAPFSVLFRRLKEKEHRLRVALTDSQQRSRMLALFIEEAPASIAMFDRDMRYLAASGRWIAHYCPHERDVVGRCHYDLFPELPEKWRQVHRRGFAGEAIRADEDSFVRPDGRTQWVTWEMRPWRLNDGTVGGIVIFAEDITDRKDAEEERRTLQAEIRRVSRLSEIGRMTAALAHELNQPLTAVATYVGGCRRMLGAFPGEDAAKQKLQEVLEQANAQALRAAEIIRRLRDFIGSGQGGKRVEDAARVLQEGAALATTSGKHDFVTVRCEFTAAAPVFVDKIQIQQVVFNLMRNAIEAMGASPRKELDVRLSRLDDCIEVSVADTGSGISPEMADRLFTPFSTTKDDGMGIGLSVCREIVEAHDGRIWAEPNPEGGTIFRFTLPLAEDGVAE